MLIRKLNFKKISKNPGASTFSFATPESGGYFSEGSQFILDNFSKRTSDERLIEDVRFVSDELVANAVEHGNIRDSNKKINIFCLWLKDKFYFVVQDEGKGFDLSRPKYRSMPPPEGSLGLKYSKQRLDLVYNFQDSCSYACKVLN